MLPKKVAATREIMSALGLTSESLFTKDYAKIKDPQNK